MLPALLVLLAFAIGAVQSPYFLDARYLFDSSTLYVETGLLAIGMTLVIISGNIDLSVASILALVAVVSGKLLEAGWPVPAVFATALSLGVVLGLINGALVAYAALPSFMVTIATLALYRGIAHAMLGSESVMVPPSFSGIDFATVPGTPIPISLPLLLVIGLLAGLVLHKSLLGAWIYSQGANERASFFSGVPTQGVKLAVFGISGLMAALAALHIDSRLGVARYDHARGLEVDVITAVVLGGTAIAGGKGSIAGTLLALLLIALLRTGMGVANVKAEYQLAVIGGLLVLTMVFSNLAERYAARRSQR